MPYIGMTSENISRKQVVLFFVIVIGLASLVYYLEYKKGRLLEDSIETTARVKSKNRVYKGGSSIFVVFQLDNQLIHSNSIRNSDCYSKVKEKDSVRIKYSRENPKIVDIIDCKPLNRRVDWD